MPYEIFPYTIDKLLELFAKHGMTDPAQVNRKSHPKYFKEYLDHIGTKTFLLEHDYIDRDYLEDYAAYYSRSFRDYNRKCVRLHLFDCELTAQILQDHLAGEKVFDFQKHYQGFIIIKPIPKCFVGRTCLITYRDDSERKFPVTQEYEVNLFGIQLSVETVPFQEQDQTVAACATSALWSVLQGTGHLFQHEIPSPVEITKSATMLLPYAGRHFPNRGLNAEQMSYAIREVNLEPYLIKADKLAVMKATISAYLAYGVPILMGVNLYEKSNQKPIGKHAVAITGYSKSGIATVTPEHSITLESSRITKLYVHDDQVGPFARMEFGLASQGITTQWGQDTRPAYAIPQMILIPVYHKIRIPVEKLLPIVYTINQVLTRSLPVGAPRMVWDIKLVDNAMVKSQVLAAANITPKQKSELLTFPMAKYLWSVSAALENQLLFEGFFDATDIEHADIFSKLLFHQPAQYDGLKKWFQAAIGPALPVGAATSFLRALAVAP